ncbi:uncharacterized protein RSE6_14601 [Rhynchosporium secalis]|uniref:Uncharacterized protein n=1 Tax=Rhynchosporium secalis TaxID=38038 RepID=A0A1E1MVR9_RHYSE|nr:uncharacterized protein RSE6_14601 [Rhynchosporium secalis]
MKTVAENLKPGKCSLQKFRLRILPGVHFWANSCRSGDERARETISFITTMSLGIAGQLEIAEAEFIVDGLQDRFILSTLSSMQTIVARFRPWLDTFEQQLLKQTLCLPALKSKPQGSSGPSV